MEIAIFMLFSLHISYFHMLHNNFIIVFATVTYKIRFIFFMYKLELHIVVLQCVNFFAFLYSAV